MNSLKHKIKQTVLAVAMAATLGTAAITEQASANSLSFNISGWLTMITPDGAAAIINGDITGAPYYGARTPVSGTMTFDTSTNSGNLTMQPFPFLGALADPMNISFQDVDGPSGAGTLMLGNMVVDFGGTVGIPVSIVWDGKGMLDAINSGLTLGDTIAATNADFACDTNINCATPATNDFPFMFDPWSTYTLPIGASPVATTTWNTTDIGTISLGTNPSGTLPLIADTIGGSPMKAGPFPGFNPNFDFDNMTVTAVPVQSVAIDIKPGSNENPINPGSQGKTPVAILTTDVFDASTVDASTVRFGTGAAVPVNYRLEDVDDDGDWDLALKFHTQETGIVCGDTEASLTGQTIDGVQIAGMDSIKTVGCK